MQVRFLMEKLSCDEVYSTMEKIADTKDYKERMTMCNKLMADIKKGLSVKEEVTKKDLEELGKNKLRAILQNMIIGHKKPGYFLVAETTDGNVEYYNFYKTWIDIGTIYNFVKEPYFHRLNNIFHGNGDPIDCYNEIEFLLDRSELKSVKMYG